MGTRIIYISILTFILSLNTLAQQDKHLSMWNENAAQFNPGAVGVMDENARLLTNFRMQWLPLNGSAMRTNTFSFDTRITTSQVTESHLGIGVNFYNDQTGDSKLTTNSFSVPIAYNIQLDRKSSLSIGISPGFYSQTIGGNQTWDNQWNGATFDQTLVNGETSLQKASSFDLGSGMLFKHKFDATSYISAGFSVNHLNPSAINYSSNGNGMFRQFNFHVSATKFDSQRRFGISPQALVTLMGPNYNILVGTYFDHELFESSQRTNYVQRSFISYGFFMRWKDAFIISAAFKTNGFKFGVSYDVNLSKLSTATRSSGGVELFLKYSIINDPNSKIGDKKLFRWKGGGGGL
jgi:type IX secretion system PorP/SprF family membrane protein